MLICTPHLRIASMGALKLGFRQSTPTMELYATALASGRKIQQSLRIAAEEFCGAHVGSRLNEHHKLREETSEDMVKFIVKIHT